MIGIPSSGDPEEDERILRRFMKSDALISEGMCPNGCGPMDRKDTSTSECPRCGFIHQKRTLYVGEQ